MKKIDINKALYGTLKKDYETHKANKHYQSQLQSGFDYMEAMVKLFGTISISIVKEIDHNVYKNIFTENFKLTPSLGDFKSLTTKSFPQVPKKKKEKALALKAKLENKNIIYDFLQILFNTKKEIEIVDVNSLLNDEVSQKTIESVWDLLENYVVSFRNKLKGHGASFKNDDTTQRELLLNNLDKTIQYLESAYDEIYNTLEFYLLEDGAQLNIQHKDSNEAYKLLPIVAYIECDKFSCSKKHKTKLFFYNDGQKTKSHYIDYSYNHFHQITQTNEINENIKKLQEEVLHSSSDTVRQSHLLTNFVGRKKELKETKEHILSSIQDNKASFFCVMGTPGIGKSAFLTQLQQNIIDDETLNKEINSYTFYAQKDKMGGLQEEDKELWKKISGYFDKHNISIKQEGEFQLKENLEKLFSAYEDSKETKPLILIIDGLDEFANPADMIRKIPLNFAQKIHLVFSSRPYANIKNALTAKFAEIEQINILHKQSLLTEGYSLQLGKLQLGEVEELLSHVLSKEIPRESTEYEEIVQTIAEKSESVPLYIHYITQELKEKNMADAKNITQELKEKNMADAKNITQEIMNWAKQLPPKLDRFYIDRFRQTSSLARKILSMLLFSHSSVSKENFYTILKIIAAQEFKDQEQKEIDEVAFIEKHFNDIEVFLSIDADAKYSFYHLSVKEQLIEYYKELGQIFTYNKEKLKDVLFESMVEYHSEMIDSMLYLKKNSDIYNLLVGLTKEVNSEDTPTYYKDNYFHILNTLIWSNIYISQINHEDMKNEKYDALLLSTQLSEQSQKEVQNFFALFNDKEQKHLFEIRYAYELAFIAEDYDSVLVYKDIYENHVEEMFLDIALNIDKPEYIQKFIEYKDDWNGAVNERIQDIIINIISQQETLDDSFYDVLLFLSDEHKKTLAYKISTKKALKIIKSIKYDWQKPKALAAIASKTDDKELLSEALEIARSIEDDWKKTEALVSIISQIDDKELLSEALEIAKSIKYDGCKSEALAAIAAKTDDKELLSEALEIARNIEDDWQRSEALAAIVTQTDDIEQAIEIAKSIENGFTYQQKVKALAAIASKTDDIEQALAIARSIKHYGVLASIASKTGNPELLSEALEIARSIEDDKYKTEALLSIASKTGNPELLSEALEIARSIEDDKYKTEALLSIASKTGNTELLSEALEIARSIEDKTETLLFIASKTGNTELLSEVLEIARSINDNEYKSKALAVIASKTNDTEQALEIARSIKHDGYRSEILASIASQTDNTKQALKIAKSIEYDWQRSKTLVAIITQTDDIEQALEIAKSIENDKYKSKALASIAVQMDDTRLLCLALETARAIENDQYKAEALASFSSQTDGTELLFEALEIARSIEYDGCRSEVLASIASQTDSTELLFEALEIARSIEHDGYRSEVLASIASQTDNTKQAVEIAKSIKDDWQKSEALASIASQTNDIEQALEIVGIIDYNKKKSKVLASIASKTEDRNLLTKILKFSIPLFHAADLFNKIKHNISTNILYKKIFNTHIQVIQTMEIITEVSPDAILRYYRIFFDNEDSPFSSLFQQLEDLLVSDLEKKERRKEFQVIKEQLLQDKPLLNMFISLYGEALDIEDEDDFDDEFTYKALEEIIDIIKSKAK